MSQEQQEKRKFRIEVENLFNNEKRKIRVKHHKKDAPAEEWEDIDFPILKGLEGESHPERKNWKTLDLSSGDHLEINLGEMGSSDSEPTDYWYVTLPLVADFKFLSESGKEVPLIYEVARNESTGGRAVVKIPTEIDPTACKLIISPPGRLEENYQSQNLTGESAADGGGSPDDNVPIGDNKTG